MQHSRGRAWIVLLPLAVVGCADVGDRAAGPTESPAPASAPERYLPYGVPVPEGQVVDALPEPYDPARHGPAIRNTAPGQNLAKMPGAAIPRRKHTPKKFDIPTIDPGSGDRGYFLYADQYNSAGIYVVNDAQTNVSIPSSAIGTTIYAPTHMSAGGTCLETVTAHYRYSGQSTTTHGHGFWDWCRSSPGWQTFEVMNSTWKSKYVRVQDGEERYLTQVVSTNPANPTGGCWQGLLWNYSAGYWEQKAYSCGNNLSGWGTTGWTMWESHYMMDQAQVCPVFPSIGAWHIVTVGTNGTYYSLGFGSQGPLGPTGLCWNNGTYTFNVPASSSNSWIAYTPYP